MQSRILLATMILVGACGLTRADDKPLDRIELDKRVVAIVYEAAVLGTDIFNKGAHGECHRLYQGTLLAVVPMLDHRSKLQATAKARLVRAKDMEAVKAAHELREAINEILNEIAPSKKDAKQSLWDRLGGEAMVKVVVHDFVAAAANDNKVNFLRDGKVKLDSKGVDHLKKILVEFVSENTGGPLKYTGKSMKEVHKGMAITDAEFDALGDVLVTTLKKYKVPPTDIDELVKIVERTRKDIVEKKN